ncbi:MAG: hypothetical protein IH998_17065 [Proteobacteria bacterium]|nr:hypothetical protein [Pseudomonadota bacterium]
MKLLRYGQPGQERAGLLDADGRIRALPESLGDLTGDRLSPAGLADIAALDPASLPVVEGKRGHPVYLRWDWVERTLLDGAGEGRRLDELIHPVWALVDVRDRAVAINLNTPEDVSSWIQRVHQEGAGPPRRGLERPEAAI